MKAQISKHSRYVGHYRVHNFGKNQQLSKVTTRDLKWLKNQIAGSATPKFLGEPERRWLVETYSQRRKLYIQKSLK